MYPLLLATREDVSRDNPHFGERFNFTKIDVNVSCKPMVGNGFEVRVVQQN